MGGKPCAGLTESELSFFVQQGYCVVPAFLDRGLCEHAVDRLWASAPIGCRLKRDDPRSWPGPFHPDDESDHPRSHRKGHTWKLREPGGEPEILALVPAACHGIAEQLLGQGNVWPVPE